MRLNSDILNRYLNLNQAARKHELDKHLLLENGKLNTPIYQTFPTTYLKPNRGA